MARKNSFPYQLLTNQSLSSSFTSPITTIDYIDNVSYQINCTTVDSIGTFSVEVSNDYAIDVTTNAVTNAGNWDPLTLGGGSPFVNAADAVIVISLNQLPFHAIRLRYTVGTAGTGTVSAYLLAKSIGA